MRHWNGRFALLAIASAVALAACGGSSAETPEPVRPDTWQLRLRQSRLSQAEQSRNEDDLGLPLRDLDEPVKPKSTWGSGRRTHAKSFPVLPAAANSAPPAPALPEPPAPAPR